IPLSDQGGSRLLLVKGADGGAPGPLGPGTGTGTGTGTGAGENPHGNPHAASGAGDLPPFGEAFGLTGRPLGTVVVGALRKASATGSHAADETEAPPSFGGIQPTPGIPVRLFVVDAQGTETPL